MTPASWLFNFLGSLIVATPEEMKQAPDFWLDNEDRRVPSSKDYGLPKIQMQQVAGEHFRRNLRKDIAILSAVAAMLLSTVIYLVALGGIKIITPSEKGSVSVPVAVASNSAPTEARAKQQGSAKPAITQKNCRQFRANLAKLGPGAFENDKQVQAFSSACADQFGI
jgi:hypothetical protein